MIAMLFVLMVCFANFAIGFGLAVHMGHGPAGLELPTPDLIRDRLRSLLHLGGKQS
jgi:hypothetical protein